MLALAAAAGIVGLTHWAVRLGHLEPFAAWPRTVRRVSDPLLQPLERWLLRHGRNPQEATLWLFGLAVLGGLSLVGLWRWFLTFGLALVAAGKGGPRAIAALTIDLVYFVLVSCLIVRVMSSWIGPGRFTTVVRWAHRLTDWLIGPIRQRLPTMGVFDLSPLFAWLVLALLHTLLQSVV